MTVVVGGGTSWSLVNIMNLVFRFHGDVLVEPSVSNGVEELIVAFVLNEAVKVRLDDLTINACGLVIAGLG